MKKFLVVAACAFLLVGCGGAKLDNGEEAVVTFSEGGISAQVLFDKLKEKYGTTEVITLIDTELLEREFDETSEEKSYIKDVISALKEQWGDDFDSNISSYYGVNSESEFEEYIRLVYRRSEWEKKYAKENVTESQVNDYYDNYAVGDITASHILIQVNDEDEEESALAKAREVITKLNNGEDFATLERFLPNSFLLRIPFCFS